MRSYLMLEIKSCFFLKMSLSYLGDGTFQGGVVHKGGSGRFRIFWGA